MAFEKKTWKARNSAYPNRRVLTDTSTGTAQTVIVTRDEGTVYEAGDGFTKTNMDGLEGRIEDAFKDEHAFFTASLGVGEQYVEFGPHPLIDTGIIPHIYVPLDWPKLIPDAYTLDTTNHKLRVAFPARTGQSDSITIKMKIETDQKTLTPESNS